MSTLRRNTHKPLFPRGPGVRLRFVVLLAVVGALLYFGFSGSNRLDVVREWGASALRPVVWLSTLPQSIASLGDDLRSRRTLIKENAAYKRNQLVLDAKLQRMQALEAENRRIRSLLASSTVIKQRVLIAEVLEDSQDPYRHQILIDKGSANGVYKGQALVDAWGVLGQVIRVHRHTAVALLVTDPENSVPVEVNRTGLHTVALGRGDGATLSLPFLPNNADIHVGDLLVSSGLGGRFPSGYPVGRVIALRHPAGESFMEAIAQPAAHVGQGREVLLVWNSDRPTAALPQLPIQVPPPGAKGSPSATEPKPAGVRTPGAHARRAERRAGAAVKAPARR
ncbi:MAG TPA: rod shape-determining protein MreC [Nevskiaceae bacterium]|nr:rod shape-determining protein MreC [Nevskiaceae bacterium]